MTPQPHSTGPSALFGWMVHAYTASGAVMALGMAVAVMHSRYRTAFFLMVAATAIDSTDGALARLTRVRQATPHFDGARLDDIVDYLTFVFIPTLLLLHSGLLPSGWGGGVVAAAM